jgi:hypothetical protein
MVLKRDQKGEGGDSSSWSSMLYQTIRSNMHISVLLVVKCIPKFNFVCFAMSHFDWNHHKERKKIETFRHFAQ